MQFSCDSCHARYNVADEKIRGKTVRVQCKRCGAPIVVSDPALAVGGGTAPAPTEARTEATAPPPIVESTPTAHSAGPQERAEWFVAIGGVEVGPITKTSIQQRILSGEVTTRTYVWRDGMQNWARLNDLPELAVLLPSRPPPLPSEVEATATVPTAASSEGATPSAVALANEATLPPQGKLGERSKGILELFDKRDSEVEISRPIEIRNDPVTPSAVVQAPVNLAASVTPGPELSGLELGEKTRAIFKDAAEKKKKRRRAPAFVLGLVGVSAIAAATGTVLWSHHSAAHAHQQPNVAHHETGPVAAANRADAPVSDETAALARALGLDSRGQPSVGSAVNGVLAAGTESEGGSSEPTKPPFDTSAVQEKQEAIKPQVVACISEAMKKNPRLRIGRLVITASVEPSGAVGKLTFSHDSVRGSELGRCLGKAIRTMHFKPFEGKPQPVEIPLEIGVQL